MSRAVLNEGDEKTRLTVYLKKSTVKKLRHVGVDEEKDISQLVENAVADFLKNYDAGKKNK